MLSISKKMLGKCLGIFQARSWKCKSFSKHFIVWLSQYTCNTKHFPSILPLEGVSESCICLGNQSFSKHIGSETGVGKRHISWQSLGIPDHLPPTGQKSQNTGTLRNPSKTVEIAVFSASGPRAKKNQAQEILRLSGLLRIPWE